MATDSEHLRRPASFGVRFGGTEVDRLGVNIHQLGRSLISSQELVNVTASDLIKREIPTEKYAREPIDKFRLRRFFLQGHVSDIRQGSLDLLIPLIAQPELRLFLETDSFRNFGISVIANLFTSAALALAGGWRSHTSEFVEVGKADRELAIKLVPSLEKLTRGVARGGFIDFSSEVTKHGARTHLRIEHGSRDRLLDFAEAIPPSETRLIGEIRSIDLDRGTATLVEAVTGDRLNLDFISDYGNLMSILGRRVEVCGSLRPTFDRRGSIRNNIEVKSITPLDGVAAG